VNVYLNVVDAYRQKDDPAGIIEYGEKVLKLDPQNLTALLALSRNYAIAGQDLDRAVELARKAVERATEMKGAPVPPNYSATSWTSYVAEAEQSAKDILVYVLAIRDRNQPASEKP
jgi:tetratricopeptide (TPR) repeat protein